ncbi:DnaJ domain-containing protein [Clostridium sp.]|uniref:J domain-containing protein n=1 Tax=Clostridium sp. TaxID=1506 RepID=UPI0026320B17|nr:DnaJ domain-containing protein [Clostridium sp.]
MDPYSVLGVTKDSSKDEIKEAYKNILDDYNSDNLDDENQAFAEDILSEANLAYDLLINGDVYTEIRSLIDKGNISLAEVKLNILDLKDSAEWNYLQGFVCCKKGWMDMGVQHIVNATDIDPQNEEYAETLLTLRSRANEIINYYTKLNKPNTPPQSGFNPCGGGGGGGMNLGNMGGGGMC